MRARRDAPSSPPSLRELPSRPLREWLETLGLMLSQDVSRVVVQEGWVARLLTRAVGAWAVTLGRRVFLSDAASRLVESGDARAFELLAHELVHVAQARQQGLVRFLARYIWEYLCHRGQGLAHHDAYLALSAEIEARGLARLCVEACSGGVTSRSAV